MISIIFKFIKYFYFIFMIMGVLQFLTFNKLLLKHYCYNVFFTTPFSFLPILLLIFIYQITDKILLPFWIIGTGLFLSYTLPKIIPNKGRPIDFYGNIFENENYIILGAILGYILLFFIFRRFYNKRKNKFFFNRKSLVKGKKVKRKGIVFKANPSEIYLKNPYRGVYIQGGAGSGKSESIFKPVIKSAAENGFSGLLYDFKSGELTKNLYKYIDKSKVKPFFIDFKNPKKSNRVNVLNPKFIKKFAYVIEYSEVIINNLLPETIKERGYFDREAQSVLTGVIWYMKKHHPQCCSLPHIIALILSVDTEQLLNKLKTDREVNGMIISLLQAMNRGAEKQVAGVISTLQSALAKLNNQDVFWLLTGDDEKLNLDLNNVDNPKFLCLGNDSTIPTAYAPVISLIISVSTRLMNEPNKSKSMIILDEAPTLYIPNIEQIPATGRSNEIATIFGVQDYSQMVDKYGKEKSEVIISNLGNQFYGRSSNSRTASMIKDIFSREDKVFISKTKGTGTSGELVHFNSNRNKGVSENIQERDRVKVSEILNSDPGVFYGIIAEGFPKEFLSYRLGYDDSYIDVSEIDVPTYTERDLNNNYEKVYNDINNLFK